MKKDQIEIGGTYTAKVSDKVVPVRIDRAHRAGGWCATNLHTNRPVRIKSARRLRQRLADPAAGANTPRQAKPTPERDRGERNATGGQRENDGATSGRPMSLLDAAAHLLSLGTGAPMRCRDIVDLAVKRNLWAPGRGRTPARTLYAAIHREIKTKGDAARFVKADRGRFALRKEE